MPIERRELTFSPSELEHAVAAYLRTIPGQFPMGRVLKVNPAQTQTGPGLSVEINPHHGGNQVITVQLDDQAIIDILVRFCLENDIPIPRAGHKRACLASRSLSLLIVLDLSAA